MSDSAKKNELTEQEKIVQKYYTIFVEEAKNYSNRQKKKNIKNFAKEFANATIVGTRYADNKISLGKENRKKTNASMNTLGGQDKDSILKINIRKFMKEYKLNSTKEKDLFPAYFKLVETANHEMTHFFQGKDNGQFKMASNMISMSEALDFSYEDVARRLDKDFYNGKRGNYHNIMKEGDARRNGYIQAAIQFFNAIPMSEKRAIYLGKKLVQSMEEDNIEYEKIYIDNSAKKHSRTDVVRYTEQAVAKNPKLYLEKFPVLKYEYMKNGQRFPLEKVWEGMHYAQSKASNKIMLERTQVGFAKVMGNILKDMTDIEMEDLIRRYGKEEVCKMIDFTRYGKRQELEQRERKLDKYFNIVKQKGLNNYVNAYAMKDALRTFQQKAGYGTHYDIETQDNYIGFENEETKFLDNLKYMIERTDFAPYSSKEEEKMMGEKVKKIREDRLELNKQKYDKRIEKLKNETKGLKKFFVRISTNLGLLEAEEVNDTYEKLSSKVALTKELKNTKNKERQELDNITFEIEDTMKKYEARKYLNKDKKYQEEKQAQEKDNLDI